LLKKTQVDAILCSERVFLRRTLFVGLLTLAQL